MLYSLVHTYVRVNIFFLWWRATDEAVSSSATSPPQARNAPQPADNFLETPAPRKPQITRLTPPRGCGRYV